MLSSLHRLSTEDLRQLADALRSGWVAPPFSSLMLRTFVPDALAADAATDLLAATEAGVPLRQLAEIVQILVSDRGQRASAEGLIDLVWTGPDVPGIVNRDTAVVVREMFRGARQFVLLAGYAVYQGQIVFKELAEQLDQNPDLRVEMFLDVSRPWNDSSLSSELVRRFSEDFTSNQWPGQRLPKVFYDPRSLETDSELRASLHAKCIVVDNNQAFVTSANFTTAAQQKNIEVGVLIRSSWFATKLSSHFQALAAAGLLVPIPVG
jgi:phosphatidylserine/phosphatidylglycerophosphate/cardiolipin synthase-like enzyme